MTGASCITPKAAEKFAKDVVKKLSESQKEKFGIGDTNIEGAIQAIQVFATSALNALNDEEKQRIMLQDTGSFIHDLDNFLSVTKVPEDAFDKNMEDYKNLVNVLKEKGIGRIGTVTFEDSDADQEDAVKIESLLMLNTRIASYKAVRTGDKVESISFIIKEPQKSDVKSAQQQTLDALRKIKESSKLIVWRGKESMSVDSKEDVPEGWRYSKKYLVNGAVIEATGVTKLLNPNEYTGPVLAGPIGTSVDAVGRMTFNKESGLLDDSGKPVKDKAILQTIIDEKLGGIFTPGGLRNLSEDFLKLEEKLKDKWGDDIVLVTDEIRLFGRDKEGNWVVGYPDLLVVDRYGVVHTIDFKTHLISSTDGYIQVFHDDHENTWRTGEQYGKQETHYNRMIEAYGVPVDLDPYIVLIDTWYDAKDTVQKRKEAETEEGKKGAYQTEGIIGIREDDDNVTSFGEYASKNPLSRESLLNPQDDEEEKAARDILYMEPRLHINVTKEKGTIKYSEDLAALRGKEDVPFDPNVSYERQWEALPKEEQENLMWLMNAKPVVVEPAQDIITASSSDIDGRPDLISTREIQDVAEFLMYKVSRTITDLQRGGSHPMIPSSMPNGEGEASTVFVGKSRKDVVKLVGRAERKAGKSAARLDNDLVALGLQRLIDIAFQGIRDRYSSDFPTEEQYRNGEYDDFIYGFEDDEDYAAQKKMNDKAKWLIDHKDQLIINGEAKLISLENFIVPKKVKSPQEEKQEFNPETPNMVVTYEDMEAIRESGDEESARVFADLHLDGITDLEAWMLAARNYSPRASLAQEIRRMFEDLDMQDPDGNVILDPYGWNFSMPMDATQAIQAVFDICKDCETIEAMIAALENAALNPQNIWVKQILDKIEQPGNENLKKKFYRHFRKDSLRYGISQVSYDKKTGKRIITTQIINTKSAYDTIKQSMGASFHSGYVGSFEIDGKNYSLIEGGHLVSLGKNRRYVANKIGDSIKYWRKQLQDIYDAAKNERIRKGASFQEYVAGRLDQKDSETGISVVEGITNILNGIGVKVPKKVVLDTCLQKIDVQSRLSNAGTLLSLAESTLKTLINSDKHKEELTSFNKKTGFRTTNKILMLVADSVQEYVESSVYQDGKTYYSYSNPSRLGHIVRNLKNPTDQYIERNFGRYNGWFKTVSGEALDPEVEGSEWLCDWLRQLTASDSNAREALSHKVEISFIGNQYKNLGALGFQLSILHNYFGSKNDRSTNANYRWFALPTMSNKPTNEFIRMLKYGTNSGNYKEEILDKVLVNTFRQEMNRMADVLYHYAAYSDRVATDQIDLTDKKLKDAEWSEDEIRDLRGWDETVVKDGKEETVHHEGRIEKGEVTVEDLIRLQKITSGAKFHFLWYLNADISNEENSDFGEMIAERLNVLLTPDDEDKHSKYPEYDELNTIARVRDVIEERMGGIVTSELEHMRKIGLFDTETKKINGKEVEILKYQEAFDGNLGSDSHGYGNALNEMEDALTEYIWQDIAANINIIQITGGDLAYYGNAVNYQKRIAQIHSPGLAVMHDDDYDDGFLRSVHISDEMIRDEISYSTEAILNDYKEKSGMSASAKRDYEKMIEIIVNGLTKKESTDGQSFSSPTSIRKKLAMQGEWDNTKQEAYEAICKGDFNINHLGVMIQPSKPFVTSDMPKYSGSTTMELRRVPLQDKNSEYLIILAEALARGSGKRSKLVAICDFMEDTAYDEITTDDKGNKIRTKENKKGIDTVHFESVNKVGKSGVINISDFDKEFDKRLKEGKVSEEDYNAELTEYLHYHVRPYKEGGKQSLETREDRDYVNNLKGRGMLQEEETLYNSQYVDTIPVRDYIIQQEVPAHLLEHQQLYGSQIRILGISDITPGTEFTVGSESISAEALIKEYKGLHAQNIRESFNELMEELGLDKLNRNGEVRLDSIDELPSKERNEVYKKLEAILQKELSKDAKYGWDTRRACWLQYDEEGNVIDFTVPLMDPSQSRRIQELINSIIKKNINKQRITGGPVVQATAYDRDLHIRFKDKKGNLLPTLKEFGGSVKEYKEFLEREENKGGIAYFECYMPIPNATLERLMTNPDGSMMSYEELFDHKENGKLVKGKLPAEIQKSLTEVIGYRIPTEDKYSMIPLKIMGFVPKAAGQVVMMPQEITYLTGSDFDIDKMYIMMKALDIKAPKVKKEDRETHWKTLAQEYFNETGKRWNLDWKDAINDIVRIGDDILYGDERMWDKKRITLTNNTKWEDIADFIVWYRNKLITEAFEEFTNQQEEGRFKARKARDNRILDLQWAVLTNADTASKILNPGNFNEQKKVGRMIRVIKSKVQKDSGDKWTWEELSELSIKELDSLLENADPHNTTLPSSKIYFQHQNMQGTQMVGIFANHNVSHAFMTFQQVGIDLNKNPLYNNSFNFEGVLIGDPNNPTILDPQKGFNGQLVSKTIASFLAASVDTAKDPVLSDLNVNTFTGGVAMVLARLGFDTTSIGLFLSQPIIERLSELYFKNSTEGFYTGDTAIEELAATLGLSKSKLQDTSSIEDKYLTIDSFIEGLSEEGYDSSKEAFENSGQKRILMAFYRLYQISHDLGKLTFCTKFNSVSNAVGPTIADTMEDADKVEDFIKSGDTNVFYIPTSKGEDGRDARGYTDPANVISNDPILSAFYETTVADRDGIDDADGASALIFKNFFPHYYQGFKNIRDHFKNNYLGGRRMSSKLYNQLLNEYLYYLMTYRDEENGFYPTIPYSEVEKGQLVKGLIRDFLDVLKIKDRKPNMILDQGLENNCLRVRRADEFLAVDTLIFNNSQLNADSQQKLKNAWSDLITYQDDAHPDDAKRIRKFGIDLFFYNLMRNGFTFSPKTMMTLASVIVKYNATYGGKDDGFQNYIVGLRKLKDVDKFLMGNLDSLENIERFCGQFVRNHANNGRLIPKIDISDKKYNASISNKEGIVTLEAPEGKETNLAKIIPNEGNPCPYINVLIKSGKTLTQELYKLEESGGSKVATDGKGGISVTYKKVARLGLTNNFIEYDANSDIEESFFKTIRENSADDMLEEVKTDGQAKDEQDATSGYGDEMTDDFNNMWVPLFRILSKSGLERNVAKSLKPIFKNAKENSRLAQAAAEIIEEKKVDIEKLRKILEDENSCIKI